MTGGVKAKDMSSVLQTFFNNKLLSESLFSGNIGHLFDVVPMMLILEAAS